MKFGITLFAAALVLTARTIFCEPSPTPTSGPQKLDVENIMSTSLDERRKMLFALNPQEREKLFDEFVQLPPGGPSNGKINALFMAWAEVDPLVAFERTKKLSTLDARRAAIEAFCYGLKTEDAPEIAKRLKDVAPDTLAPDQKERLLSLTIVKWSQQRPAEAAHFLAQLYPDAARRVAKPSAGDGDLLVATKGVATNWGRKEPEAALEFFKKSEPENVLGVQFAIAGWWEKDPKAAASYVGAHTGTPNEREIAGGLAGMMAQQDPRVAMRWVEWMKDETLRRRTRIGIVTLWATKAPGDAAAWAQKATVDGADSAVLTVAGVWATSDPKGTEEWIDTLKDQKRDAAIRGYALSVMRTNPEQALNWVMKVHNSKLRASLAKGIVSEWATHNSAAAEAWVKKSKLSAADKKQLLDGAPAPD